MKHDDRPAPRHLTCSDLNGVGASLRTIFAVTDDGTFDAILRDLDAAHALSPFLRPQAANGNSRGFGLFGKRAQT